MRGDRPLRAVWATSRAAIRRRRLQTLIIGLVVMLSTTTVVIGLGLLNASNGPFEQAFAAADGAHLIAAFDPARATGDQVAATAHAPDVSVAAGPFRTVLVGQARISGEGPPLRPGMLVAGRADPGGPVDRLTLTSGRWVRSTGEIVLLDGFSNRTKLVGDTVTPPGSAPLTVVGVARSVTQTADAWVMPQQAGLLHPSGTQMLYRFKGGDAATGLTKLKAALPQGAVLGGESWLTAKQQFQDRFNQMIPFIVVFGTLALIVSVLIVANAISGAVISGFRHIGIMKSLGFTPLQVAAAYFLMIAVPAVVGGAIGLVFGDVGADGLAGLMARDFQLPSAAAAGVGTDAAAIAGIMGLVTLSTLVPVMRAGRLPAVEAIRARAVSRSGRGRGVQRWLARTSLPRSVSLGLSLPFAKPGRAALTFAVIFLGATTTVFGAGLFQTVAKVTGSNIEAQSPIQIFPSGATVPAERTVETILHTQPGIASVLPEADVTVNGVGGVGDLTVQGFKGDVTPFLSKELLKGRLFQGPGEAVANEGLLKAGKMKVGDTLDLVLNGRRATVRIVGATAKADRQLLVGFGTIQALTARPSVGEYWIRTRPGANAGAIAAALTGPLSRHGLIAVAGNRGGMIGVVFDTLSLLFTLIICGAAGLGILYTVVLTTRDRSRDLGILKALGMTPREVRFMMITSMSMLGALAGLVAVPTGVLTHHVVAGITGSMIGAGMKSDWVHVYSVPLLLLLGSSGLVIAVLGSLIPSGWAAATRTATVLRSE
jgi:putative ABC transport system permease protein